MKKKLLFGLLLLLATTVYANSFTRYVNPLIGTGGHGHVFLGANVPFGMVQLGPTQPSRGWDWCSGYHYSDSIIRGFGHTHLSGTGIGDLGDIALLPTFEANKHTALFTHDAEYVRPGYYTVRLADSKILVELTATERAGMHRYTFPLSGKDALITLNLEQGIGWDKMTQCEMNVESPTLVTGKRYSTGWAKQQYVYFVAEFSSQVNLVKKQGDSIGVFCVDNSTQPLLVKVGISAVSVENAKENLEAEIPHWDFDAMAQAADEKWNQWLSRIEIDTDNDDVRTIFYTALYHAGIAPSIFSDIDGTYRGSDGKVHAGDKFTNYTILSLWDTYRAYHPMMTLIAPDMQPDFAQTFMHIFKEQGKLPVWHLMGNETNTMVGTPGIAVLADLALKGYVKDVPAAFEAMKTSALLDERSLALLKKYGYLPWDKDPEHETVAKGLEYALAFSGIAKVANMLGKKADAKYFYNQSMSYKKYFDENTHFMRALSVDGKFRLPFDPFRSTHRTDDYTEGNAWQYTWLVPHDPHGLVKLFGSERAFTTKLDSLFVVEGHMGADASPDISGLIGQYAHGNEPSHHILYLYNYVGQPWKGAKLIRRTLNEMYHNGYDGLSGNEDVGQMSAWYILSAVGLYQVEPCGGKFMIGSPIMHSARLNVGNGKSFVVEAHENSTTNFYVQRALLNGKPLKRSYLTYEEIMKGGKLELFMGSKPSAWGTKKNERP